MSVGYVTQNVCKNLAARAVGHRQGGGRFGMDGDPRRVFDALERLAPGLSALGRPLHGATTLEIGYGRTLDLCASMLLAGAARAVAVETVDRAPADAESGARYAHLAGTLTGGAPNFLRAVNAYGAVAGRQATLGPGDWPIERHVTTSGRLPLEDESIDLTYSKSVLEHVRLESVPTLLAEIFRVLRPGAVAIHLIDLRDHMWIDGDHRVTGDWLDALTYTEPMFRAMFSRRSTSINRLRAPAWQSLLLDAGFEIATWKLERLPLPLDFDRTRLRDPWSRLSAADLSVTWILVALRRPPTT